MSLDQLAEATTSAVLKREPTTIINKTSDNRNITYRKSLNPNAVRLQLQSGLAAVMIDSKVAAGHIASWDSVECYPITQQAVETIANDICVFMNEPVG